MAKGKGRQKIEIQKIVNETNRQVTFSKRRGGIFKKSSELTTLCGAEAAVVVFSPSNKAHSFGSPSVVTVTTRFRKQTALGITEANQSPTAHDNPIVRQRNQDLTTLGRYLEIEKQHKKELNRLKKAHQPNLDELTLEQLTDLREFITNFKHAFETKLNDGGDNKTDEVSKEKPGAEWLVGGLPATTPVGEPIKDPNNQGQPDDNVDDPFKHNEDLFGGVPLSGSSEPSTFRASLFDVGSFGNTHDLFPDPTGTIYAGPGTTTNPLDPTGNNFEYQYPDPDEATSSELVFPYNYGCPPNFVPDDDGASNDGKD